MVAEFLALNPGWLIVAEVVPSSEGAAGRAQGEPVPPWEVGGGWGRGNG